MSDSTLFMQRGARHISLPQIGQKGQQLISDATVLIVGMGGLGCAAASYLNSSGIGRMIITDFDSIDASNLSRQILFGPDDIGKSKIMIAKKRLNEINPINNIEALSLKINQQELEALQLNNKVIILDCSDNFNTRFEINKYCVRYGHYLVSGSAIRFEGHYSVFGNDYKLQPCYECLYKAEDESLEDCQGSGVLSPIPGVIGAMMATETIKIICNIHRKDTHLNIFEGISNEWRQINIKKNNTCSICN
ncbi:MAG: HesA/MoeB/ThiF family protein [Woeseiaceae bacterium]|jgi:molybdopterin-synthase adenylyltransferase|nr:HesA/MoeB/ThiF family protein [Woeseiaceae bacterium]MDG1016849.1 HesA/MoeB/ThiF family protein [Woeseiaceae bacterium]MDG1712708.1 HesA/MoeB/ThiF family protein [Woeseiaceae bacterium]MDG1865614.1 HesA/MoeB/ThiF family protein [Woeseiaceae bacterium]